MMRTLIRITILVVAFLGIFSITGDWGTEETLTEEVTQTTTIDSTEWLWLARAVFSETKKPHEQRLVGWATRNRVETQYRGNRTYRSTVLDSLQYSAFNPYKPGTSGWVQKNIILGKELSDTLSDPTWKQAVSIAKEVLLAPESDRPFPIETRHFYSERSMKGGKTPDWASGYRLAGSNRFVRYETLEIAGVDPTRFRFVSGVH